MLVLDEAQRTYMRGRKVTGHTLADHEADLALRALEDTHGDNLVVVALLGQNQTKALDDTGNTVWLTRTLLQPPPVDTDLTHPVLSGSLPGRSRPLRCPAVPNRKDSEGMAARWPPHRTGR